jgi:fructose-bisphosphate aldolase class I
MTSLNLESVALTLVAEGKGILAANETTPTLTKRFDTLGIQSTERSRRTYREMLFTCPGAVEFISGVIMYDETIRQRSSDGTPLVEILTAGGIVPGIKVDTGAKPLAGSPNETVTEGLDGLRDRLREYHAMGARFAKWRAVIHVTDTLPSAACVSANAHASARNASLCQEQELVPIVEPEVDRFHLVSDVIDRVPKLGSRAAYAKQAILDKLIDHKEYIRRYGDDMPEITGWRWGQEGVSTGVRSTEADNV